MKIHVHHNMLALYSRDQVDSSHCVSISDRGGDSLQKVGWGVGGGGLKYRQQAYYTCTKYAVP